MKKRMLAFSIACAVLFAETSAVCGIGASAAWVCEDAGAGEPVQQEEAAQKKIILKAYQINPDQVKILLNRKEMDLASASYSSLLNGLYPSYPGRNYDEELPEDTVSLLDWFTSPDGHQRLDRYGKLASQEDHAIYYMRKNVPVHYVKFDAGEGKLRWNNSKPSYSGNIRETAENEIVVPDQSVIGYQKPEAEWGTREFLGWYTATEGGERLESDTVVTGEKEQTYYAHWGEEGSVPEHSGYIIRKYEAADKDGDPSLTAILSVDEGASYGEIFKNSGSYASVSSAATVDQNEFAPGTAAAYDWYTEKDGGFIVDRSSEELVPGDTAIYYRRGIFPVHYISFDAGAGEVFWDVSSSSYYEGNVPDAAADQITAMEDHRVSDLPSAEYGTHRFIGWFTEPEGGTQYLPETVYKEKGDLKLYAHWGEEGSTQAPKGTKVRICYVDDETGEISSYRDYRGEDCANYDEVLYGKNHSYVSRALPYRTPKAGMEIPPGTVYRSAYFSEPEGGKLITLDDPLLKNEDHSIYFRLDFIPYYHVLFDANGGKVFWNGYRDTSTYSDDRELADQEITIVKGSTFSRLPEALNGTRKFLGWFTAPEGGEQIKYGAYFNGDKDTTYYAHWDEEGTAEPFDGVIMNCYTEGSNPTQRKLYYSIRVDKGTAYASAVRKAPNISTSVRKDEEIPEGMMPKMLWYTEPEGGICANGSTDSVPDHEFALYSRRELVKYHYVKFDPNGGDLSYFDEAAAAAGYGQPVMTTVAVPYSSSTSTTTVRQPASDEIMVTEGNIYRSLMKAYQDNKEFLGWFTDPVGGTKIAEDTVFTGTGDQTLYAHWSGAETDPVTTTAPAPTTTGGVTTTTTKVTTTTTRATTTTTKATTATTKATTTTTKAPTTTAKTSSTTARVSAPSVTTAVSTGTQPAEEDIEFKFILDPPTKTEYYVGETPDYSGSKYGIMAALKTQESEMGHNIGSLSDIPELVHTEKESLRVGDHFEYEVTFMITIDRSKVDTSKPGVYPVTLTATNEAGTYVYKKESFNITVIEKPAVTTTTAKVTTTTTKAATTTTKPVTTTTKPVTTTTKPVTTTTEPVTTTTEPVTTTTKLVTTTTEPVTTTTEPVTTTTKPVTTTTKPVTTTTEPVTTTTEPVTTTQSETTAVTTTEVTTTEITTSEAVTTAETTPTEPEVLTGDVDENGEVSIEDVQTALKAYTVRVSGKDHGLTAKQVKAADVNADGELSVDDVQNILIYYVNNTVAGKKLTWDELLGKKAQPRPDVPKQREDFWSGTDKMLPDAKNA